MKRSKVLSDDVTVIVEIKECEGTGFSSSKRRFSKPASIYGEKKKWCPRGIFYLIYPARRIDTVIQRLNATG